MSYLNVYGQIFDPSEWFTAARQRGGSPDWPQLFELLYHQGDINTASFAAVPYITGIVIEQGGSWQPYALVASIEEARQLGKGPEIPRELEAAYYEAIKSLVHESLKAFDDTSDRLLIKSFIAMLSLAKGQTATATFALLDEEEQAELLAG